MNKFDVIKVLSDESRFRIVTTLMDYDELYVSEICAILHLKQANTSKHLKQLKSNNIVVSKREGNITKYRVNEVFIRNHLLLIKYLLN